MNNDMIVFVIDYENNKATWKAYVLAESRDDAMAFITASVGGTEGFRINNTEQRERLHAVTPRILDKIRPENIVKTVKGMICPWCDEEFTNPRAFQIHIGKVHTNKTAKAKMNDRIENGYIPPPPAPKPPKEKKPPAPKKDKLNVERRPLQMKH